jgi:hypothetical protein
VIPRVLRTALITIGILAALVVVVFAVSMVDEWRYWRAHPLKRGHPSTNPRTTIPAPRNPGR